VFVFSSTIVLSWLGQRGRLDLTGAFFSGVGLGIASSGSVVLVLHHLAAGSEVWRWEWLALAILAALLTAPSWAWLPRTNEGISGQTQESPPHAGEDAQWHVILLLGTAYLLAGAGYIVAGTFLVAIVGAMPQLADLGAGAWILVGLAAAPSTILWFRCASRIGAIAALGLAYLSQSVSLVLPVLSHHAASAALSAVLFGGSFMGITALTIGEGRRRVPARLAARTVGILTTLFALGQVIGPLLAALLAEDHGSFDRSLLVAAGAVAVGALLVGVAAMAARPQRTGGARVIPE
jgi:predicted MFS family arabinose efflux permease